METGKVLYKINMKSPIETINITTDNKYLYVGQTATDKETPTLSQINLENGSIVKIIEQSNNVENHIWKKKIDNTNKYLIYLIQQSGLFKIVIYNTDTGEKYSLLENEKSNKYEGFTINHNNNLVFGINNKVEIWDFMKKIKINEVVINQNKKINDTSNYTLCKYSPNNSLLSIGGMDDGKIILFDIKTEKISSINIPYLFPRDIIFDFTGKYIFILDNWMKGVFVWDIDSNKRCFENYFNEKLQNVRSLDIRKQNDLLAYGMNTSWLVITDYINKKEKHSDKIHNGRITDLKFTPDGKKLVSAGEDGQIIVRSID